MEDKIVIYRNEPGLVLGETTNGKGYILRCAGKMRRVVLKECVEPYTGDKDAVALGLKEAPADGGKDDRAAT
jgi:hypothetical protein